MKLVRLQGGLGNQMFQYAFCKLLEKNGASAKLDARHLGRYTPPRSLALNRIFADADRYSWNEGEPWEGRRASTALLARHVLSSRLLRLLGSREIIVESSGAAVDAAGAAAAKYFGYWQSEDVVRQVEQELRQALIALTEKDKASLHVGALRDDDVALHVRRGDYATHARAAEHHGVLPLDYYQQASGICAARGCRRAIVFSDDIEWCRHNLRQLPLELVFIDPVEGRDADAELRLMLEFKHHIIANSTFSWWGARLARHGSDGVTVAPLRWFVKSKAGFLPASWNVV